MYFQSDRLAAILTVEIRARRYEGNLVPVEKAAHWISLPRRDFPDRSPEIRGTNDYDGTNQVSSGGVYDEYTTSNNNQRRQNESISDRAYIAHRNDNIA